MNRPVLLPCNRTRPPAFVLWGWAVLLLVLLSAAPTNAQPCARLIGSAFDPSTVSVAVGPNTRDESTSVKKLRSNGPTDDAPDQPVRQIVVAANDAEVLETGSAPRCPNATRSPADLTLHALLCSQPTRAPPLG